MDQSLQMIKKKEVCGMRGKFFCFFVFCFFVVSCATPRSPEEELTLAEEEAFLIEEEEDFDFEAELERPDTEEFVAESEEDAAESEIENIEDEFSDFIEEQDIAFEEESSDEDVTEPSSDFEEEESFEESFSLMEEEEDLIAEDEDVFEEETVEGPSDEEEDTSSDIAETDFEEPEVIEGDFVQKPSLEEDIPSNVAETDFEELPLEDIAEPVVEESFVESDSGIKEDEEPMMTSSESVSITNIRYDQGQIFIDTLGDEVSYRSRFNEATRQLIIELTNSVIADGLKWPYIMKEFQSDFALLQADQKTEDTVRIIIQMHPESEAPTVVQKDDNSGLIVAGSSGVTNLTVGDVSEDDTDPFESLDEFSSEEEGPLSSDEFAISENQILGATSIYDFLLKDHKFFGNRVTWMFEELS